MDGQQDATDPPPLKGPGNQTPGSTYGLILVGQSHQEGGQRDCEVLMPFSVLSTSYFRTIEIPMTGTPSGFPYFLLFSSLLGPFVSPEVVFLGITRLRLSNSQAIPIARS